MGKVLYAAAALVGVAALVLFYFGSNLARGEGLKLYALWCLGSVPFLIVAGRVVQLMERLADSADASVRAIRDMNERR